MASRSVLVLPAGAFKSIRRAARLASGVVRSTVMTFEGALVMRAALAMVGTPPDQLNASPQLPLLGAVQMDCAWLEFASMSKSKAAGRRKGRVELMVLFMQLHQPESA